MQRCVIIGGAEIHNYEFIKNQLMPDDYFIFCDSGLMHLKALGVTPSLIIGDFDSHPNPMLDVETLVLPVEKDDTDTVFAVKEAINRGFESFLFIGTVGGRLDHSLVNVYILVMLREQGKKAFIADDYSIMELLGSEPTAVKDDCAFFSLINITGQAEGITIENAKYPLNEATIGCSYQYGCSNEVLPGMTATVSVKRGNLLLIRVYKDAEKHI